MFTKKQIDIIQDWAEKAYEEIPEYAVWRFQETDEIKGILQTIKDVKNGRVL